MTYHDSSCLPYYSRSTTFYLLHSPLRDFGRLQLSLNPNLQVSSCSLRTPFQAGTYQLFLLLDIYSCWSIILLYRGYIQYEAIWNVKKKSEIFTIFQTSMKWIWKQSEAILNLRTPSKMLCANMKPVWNHSEANLKNALIWNILILIIWSHLKYTETILEV